MNKLLYKILFGWTKYIIAPNYAFIRCNRKRKYFTFKKKRRRLREVIRERKRSLSI